MQAPEQQSIDDGSAASTAEATNLVQFTGYLADADSDDEVQLRESVVGETGQWLVFRRDAIVEQQPVTGPDLDPGQTDVWVSPGTDVVVRSRVPAWRVQSVLDATRPLSQPDRW